MLERSYSTVLPVAQELAEAGFALSPIPSSLVSQLCSLSQPVEFDRENPGAITQDTDLSLYGMMLGTSTSGESGGAWGAVYDNAVRELSTIIRTQVDYLRNVVKPRITEFASESAKYVQELGSSSPTSFLEIERLSLPDFVQDSVFVMLLDKFKNRDLLRPNTWSVDIPFTEEPASFLDVSRTGNARVDSAVALWANGLKIDYLKSVWYSFFCGGALSKPVGGAIVDREDLFSMNLSVRLNTALAYFLIANYYSNNLPNVPMHESASVIENRLFEHQLFAATALIRCLKMFDDADRRETLVNFIDSSHKKIVVFDTTYNKFLLGGGSAETILAILVGETHVFSLQEVNENQETLKAVWRQYTTVYLESVEMKKADSLRNFYLGLLNRFLNEEFTDEVEKNFLLTHPGYHTTTFEDLRLDLRKVSKEALLNTSAMATHILSTTKYRFTCAQEFFNNMARVEAQNPNADPNEAAGMATLLYIVDYIAGQVRGSSL